MPAPFRQFSQALRPILVGWLAALLLVPAALGVFAGAATPLAAVDVAALCSDTKDQNHGDHQHQQECPCCLPGAGPHLGLSAPHLGMSPSAVTAVDVFHLPQLASAFLAHVRATPPATGPPASPHV